MFSASDFSEFYLAGGMDGYHDRMDLLRRQGLEYLTWTMDNLLGAHFADCGYFIKTSDNAMFTRKSPDTGGIDLSSDKALQVKNDGQGGINFKVDQAMLQQLKDAQGLMPVRITVLPLANLKNFLDGP